MHSELMVYLRVSSPSLLTGSTVMMTCSLQGIGKCGQRPFMGATRDQVGRNSGESWPQRVKGSNKGVPRVPETPSTSFLALAPGGQRPSGCLRFESSSAAF